MRTTELTSDPESVQSPAQPAAAGSQPRDRGPDTTTLPGGGPQSAAAGALEAERVLRAGLSRVIEPGDPAALEAFEGLAAAEIWELMHSGAPRMERWAARLAYARPEHDLERIEAVGGRFVIPGDDEWPEQVEVLADAGQQSRRGGVPFGLWVRGAANLCQTTERSVALVGARACSSYGEHAAAELAAGLADSGITVVSGGAYGIDAAAHRGALATAPHPNTPATSGTLGTSGTPATHPGALTPSGPTSAVSGPTVAVLACGVDVSYPRSNTALFDRIAEEGLIVSELPPGCSPTKLRFLARNRLIAATTLGTVVVEAAVRSGALNSAGWAEQCGRAVLAVPGPITSRMSEGVHLLVRERNAVLVTCVTDILEAISPLGQHLTPYRHAPVEPTDELDLETRRTLDAVPVLRAADAGRIAATAGLDLDTVQECLETLDQADLVEFDAPGWRLSATHRRSLGTPP